MTGGSLMTSEISIYFNISAINSSINICLSAISIHSPLSYQLTEGTGAPTNVTSTPLNQAVNQL